MNDNTCFQGPPGSARVLVVDDEEVICSVLQAALEDDFALCLVDSAERAFEVLSAHPVDVVLADKNLPGKNGIELLKSIRLNNPDMEVLVMTGYASLESSIEALRHGAFDYLIKPFDDIHIVVEKVRRAVRKVELQREHKQLMNQLVASNAELRDAHSQLRLGYIQTLTSMITALEARDAYTRGHSDRVAEFSVIIGREMGLRQEQLDRLQEGAQLHDLGKIGIREDILNKTGKLTDEEYDHIKEHPQIGADILDKMEAYRHVLPMVRHHHERFDGRGYPSGLAGLDIPAEARIIAVADCFDAMTSTRPYRDPRPTEVALKIVREVSGSQLDPTVVGAFLMAHRRGQIRTEGS